MSSLFVKHVLVVIIFINKCSPREALFDSFVKTDASFRSQLESHHKSRGTTMKDSHPGCTATAALIIKNKLFVANAGDCRTILCRSDHVFPLSKVTELVACILFDRFLMRCMSKDK